jgi:8-oxo-dGTP pyrophosphatase MutT (NUDIX family)
MLCKQLSCSQGTCCIELPSGLSDGDEPPEATALRELREETGYTGTCGEVSPVIAGEPGMTNNSLRLVTMDIDLDASENVHALPQPEARSGPPYCFPCCSAGDS